MNRKRKYFVGLLWGVVLCLYADGPTIELRGTVKDKSTGEPLSSVNISLEGTSISTISNHEGNFLFKIPAPAGGKAIFFRSIGFLPERVKLKDASPLVVRLVPDIEVLDTVVVTSGDALSLVQKALSLIPQNNSPYHEMQTAFYRETVRKGKRYVSIAEAVLDVNKAPYNQAIKQDRLKIFKARKQVDVSFKDTIMLKLQGGPATSYMLDIAKDPDPLFSYVIEEGFDFSLGETEKYNRAECFTVHFKCRNSSPDIPWYNGIIYIEKESYAIVGVDFFLSPEQKDAAERFFVKRKPSKYSISMSGMQYSVRYIKEGKYWKYAGSNGSVEFSVKKRRRLFKRHFTLAIHMAITDRDSEHLSKPKWRDMVATQKVLLDNVSHFDDPHYWGDYNIIKPEEPIEEAIKKMGKKLKRKRR